MRGVPWWGVVSSAAAPALLVGGWTAAAALQARSYDQVTKSVSALAAIGAADRWVMTSAFFVVAACEVVTGLALRSAGPAGRLVLTTGGIAGMLVAVNPLPVGSGFSLEHVLWAAVGFGALSAWPAGAWRRASVVPWGLRPTVCGWAAALLVGLLAWFVAEVAAGGGQIGLAERVLGGAQTTWPLLVVLSCRLSQHRARRVSAPATELPPSP